MKRKIRVSKRPGKKTRKKAPRIDLKIAKGLDILDSLPEGVLSRAEQAVLKRIDSILRGTKAGKLTQADYQNMKRIASKHSERLP